MADRRRHIDKMAQVMFMPRQRRAGFSVTSATSGRQSNRNGRIVIPIPRLTYIREVRFSYQPEMYSPEPRGSQSGLRNGNRIWPPWVCPANAMLTRLASSSK
jgi:hypothetical protein